MDGFLLPDTLVSMYWFDKDYFARLLLAVRIFWGFDNSLQDLYNNFNGVGTNGPTYTAPGYNGAGTCLSLSQSSYQSVTIATPFLNMAYTSFTLEVWVYANTLRNSNPYTDNAIFGQFQQNTTDKSLYIIIRNQRAYFGFCSDDVVGIQVSKLRGNHMNIVNFNTI
jgi:hypothetical protein